MKRELKRFWTWIWVAVMMLIKLTAVPALPWLVVFGPQILFIGAFALTMGIMLGLAMLLCSLLLICMACVVIGAPILSYYN